MNILVTGANGQLGNEMRIVSKGSSNKFVFTDVMDASEESIAMLRKLAGSDINTDTEHLDITNLEAIREVVKRDGIDVIVNCAAYTNVDAAEDNYELAELLNAKAPENLAIAMKEVGGLLVHISTDYVFGGDPYNTPCNEDQQGTPTGVYGLTKLHGEQNIIRVLGDGSSPFTGDKRGSYVIIRTAWLYSEFGKNFVKTMLHLTATKPQLKVVFDQVGTPTYAYDLAQAISVIISDYKNSLTANRSTITDNQSPITDNQSPITETSAHQSPITYSKSGVYHFSNEGVCSWYDFTKMIQQIAVYLSSKKAITDNQLPINDYRSVIPCEVLPCHSDEFPSPVKRPAYSVLDKTKIKDTYKICIPYWLLSLTICIKKLA